MPQQPRSGLSTIAIDPRNPATLYADFGGDSAGLFGTSNAGKAWERIGDFGPTAACSVLAVDPVHDSTLYAGVSTPGESGSVGAVLKSSNAGATWSETGLSEPGLVVSSLVIDARNPSVIYAGFAGGGASNPGSAHKSQDGGATWNVMSDGLPPGDVFTLEIDPTEPSIVYAGTSNGLFKTGDAGANWNTLIDAPISALAIDPTQPMVLYAGVQPNTGALSVEGRGNPRKRIGQGGVAAGLIKSADGGANWALINKGLPSADIVANRILIDVNDPSAIYLACSEGLFASSNGGRRWRGTDLSGFSVRAITQSSAGTVYAQGDPSDDAFVTKLGPTGNVVYSTYFGGLSEDQGLGVALDIAGNAYLAGTTTSKNLFTRKAAQAQLGGAKDVFVTEISSTGRRILYSSYLGGSGDDVLGSAGGVAVDQGGNVYVAGTTQSVDFPTLNPLQANLHGILDVENPPRNAFMSKLAHTGRAP